MPRQIRPRWAWLVFVICGLAGCAGGPSALDDRGPAAARINLLWWVMLGLGTAVFLLVTALLLLALFRRRGGGAPTAEGERRLSVRMLGGGGVALPLFVLVPLLGFTAYTGATMTPRGERPLVVEVIGHQFWWEIRYPEQGFTTANELVIPVGRPVELRLSTADVIHSFWVPQLNGKMDLIPGRSNTLTIQADEPGEYRGQCAEFCGRQHALMAMVVVAEPPARFAAWAEAQARPAAAISDPLLRQGQQIFLGSACIYCHVVRGHTEENSAEAVGPDLTHLASRRTLAAATLPNTRGNLAGWLVDPQAIKPGNHMPGTDLDAASLQALLAYLESLE
jgi:cytochrome c oxidase subunit 2